MTAPDKTFSNTVYRVFLPLVALSLLTTNSWAAPTPEQQSAAFINKMIKEHSFDEAYVRDVVAAAEKKQSILDAMSRPAEKVKPWHEYRDIFITDKRINEGVEFWEEHREQLERISSETGVPVQMIVAIIGVETFYGRITGSYRVVDALSTLAFYYPKRSAFFTKELEQYLLLAREESLGVLDVKGSYAGAMGPPQFMPSSYRAYAKDGDGDGRRDLLGNWADIQMSIANYFIAHRWHAGKDVVFQAQLKQGAAPVESKNELKPKFTLSEIRAMGLEVDTGLPDDTLASLFVMDGENGTEYWVGLHNFYVITRYNHSSMYALAAWQLGDAIASRID